MTECANPTCSSRSPEPQVTTAPDIPAIRERLTRILGEARQASDMPWDARTVRSYETAFPHLAAWLPAEEGEALCAAFRHEMARLKGSEAA
jgi:hypothetical protein